MTPTQFGINKTNPNDKKISRKKEIECQGCGIYISENDVHFIQIKTCCSVMKIPVCCSCREKFYDKPKK